MSGVGPATKLQESNAVYPSKVHGCTAISAVTDAGVAFVLKTSRSMPSSRPTRFDFRAPAIQLSGLDEAFRQPESGHGRSLSGEDETK